MWIKLDPSTRPSCLSPDRLRLCLQTPIGIKSSKRDCKQNVLSMPCLKSTARGLGEGEREDLALEKDSDTTDQDCQQIRKFEAGQAFAPDANPISREETLPQLPN